MNISVELTLSPLQDTFEDVIIHFIKKLRNSGLTILENPLTEQYLGISHRNDQYCNFCLSSCSMGAYRRYVDQHILFYNERIWMVCLDA